MAFVFIGIGAIIIGVVMFFLANRKKSHVMEMKFLKTSKIKELFELHSELLKSLGPDSIKQLVEIKGDLKTSNPLTSEIAQEKCMAYKYSVEERYEEEYEEQDSDGNIIHKTRSGYNTVESNERRTEFSVTDDTGTITVDPDGAPLDMEKSTERYEPWNQGMQPLTIGAFTFGNMSHSRDRRRILGYRISEYVFPVNRRVYVVGEMQDANNKPLIRKPMEKDKPFIISLKSEEEVIKGAETSATVMNVIGIVFVIAGIASIVYNFVK
jgi:hypothetical protein